MIQRHLALGCLFALAFACAGESGPPTVAVSGVIAPAPVVAGSFADASMAVYATLRNESGVDDTLTAVESDAARRVTLHATMDHGGMAMMMPSDELVVPARRLVRLEPGGTHVMLESLVQAFAPGDSVPVAFIFRHAGRVTVTGRVVSYEGLEDALRAAQEGDGTQ